MLEDFLNKLAASKNLGALINENSPQGGVPISPAPLSPAGCLLLPSLAPGLSTASSECISPGADLLFGRALSRSFLALAAGAPAPLHRIDRPPLSGPPYR